MCYCDAEVPQFFNEQAPRARKSHLCGECNAQIDPGSRYFRYSGLWDGHFNSYVRCAYCADTARFMAWWSKQVEGCFCDTFTGLRDAVHEEWREGRSRLIGRIYIAMQRRLFNARATAVAKHGVGW